VRAGGRRPLLWLAARAAPWIGRRGREGLQCLPSPELLGALISATRRRHAHTRARTTPTRARHRRVYLQAARRAGREGKEFAAAARPGSGRSSSSSSSAAGSRAAWSRAASVTRSAAGAQPGAGEGGRCFSFCDIFATQPHASRSGAGGRPTAQQIAAAPPGTLLLLLRPVAGERGHGGAGQTARLPRPPAPLRAAWAAGRACISLQHAHLAAFSGRGACMDARTRRGGGCSDA